MPIEIPQSMKILTQTVNPASSHTVPSVTVVEIDDPTAVGQSIEVIEQDVVQLEPSPLRARRVVVRLGNAIVLFHSTNRAVRTRTRLHPDMVAYTTVAPQSHSATVNGLPIGPDRVLAFMPGIEVELVVAAGYESVAFLLPPDDIRAHLRSLHREDEFRIPVGVELLTPSPTAAQGLYRWGRRVVDMAVRQPEVFDVMQTQDTARVELLEHLVATIFSAVRVGATSQDLTLQEHSRVVQIAEDFTLSHPTERVYVTDLCDAAGVSERTLQYAFHEVMRMTPVAYLTRLRLHRVRQALRAATPASTTVTREALQWGFWHFGDFSKAYKDCFGELPSDTLRRPPDGK